MPQHSIIASDGSHSYVPPEQVPAAIRAGGAYAVQMQAPDGSTWHIPAQRIEDAIKAGGKLLDRAGAMTPVKVNAEPKEAETTAPDLSALSGNSPGADLSKAPDVLSTPVMPRMAMGRDYLEDPKIDAALNDLYSKASGTFNPPGGSHSIAFNNEHMISVGGDGSIQEYAGQDRRSMKASVPTDSQMIIHSHPGSAQPVPSEQDYATATKLGRPNFIVSRNAIYVAMPGQDPQTSKHVKVADIDRKHGKLIYKWI
jgi:hypothetical protein